LKALNNQKKKLKIKIVKNKQNLENLFYNQLIATNKLKANKMTEQTTNQASTQNQKTKISQEAFDKKVDVEFAYLTYMDLEKPVEARAKAEQIVSQQFTTR
jgi:hypothetical protein